jgi:hypothetical protein
MNIQFKNQVKLRKDLSHLRMLLVDINFTDDQNIFEQVKDTSNGDNDLNSFVPAKLGVFKSGTTFIEKHGDLAEQLQMQGNDYFVSYETVEELDLLEFQLGGALISKDVPSKKDFSNKDSCDEQVLYWLTLEPKDFEYIYDATVHSSFKIFVFVNSKCAKETSLNVVEQITGYSISFLLLILTNLFEFKLLQMFNMKDMMGLFFNDKLQESQEIMDLVNYLNIFDCQKQNSLVSINDSYESNQKVKSYFIKTQGK